MTNQVMIRWEGEERSCSDLSTSAHDNHHAVIATATTATALPSPMLSSRGKSILLSDPFPQTISPDIEDRQRSRTNKQTSPNQNQNQRQSPRWQQQQQQQQQQQLELQIQTTMATFIAPMTVTVTPDANATAKSAVCASSNSSSSSCVGRMTSSIVSPLPLNAYQTPQKTSPASSSPSTGVINTNNTGPQ